MLARSCAAFIALALLASGCSHGGGSSGSSVLVTAPPVASPPPPPPPPPAPPPAPAPAPSPPAAPAPPPAPSYGAFVSSQPASPLVGEPFALRVELRDPSNQLFTATSDLAVTVAAVTSGLEPRVLTGKIAAGQSSTVLAGARIAQAGSVPLAVQAGTAQAQLVLTASDRVFAGTTAPEVQLDAGGPGLDGYAFAELGAVDSQVACAFADDRVQGASHVFVNGLLDAGATWKGPHRADRAPDPVDAWDAALAVDGGGLVAAAWCDRRALETGAVYANVSLDGGQTFGASDVRVDAASTRTNMCTGARVACSAGRIFVAWIDERDASIGATVYIARSLDQGKTFAEQRVDVHGAGPWSIPGRLGLVACGDDVSVLWVEKQGTTTNVVVSSSRDGGSSFTLTALNATPTAHVADARLVASGGVLHASWCDDRAGAGAFTRRSSDGGATWDAEVAIPLGAKVQVASLALAASGSQVVALAAAQSSGGRLVPLVARSTDGGASFALVGPLPQGTTDSVRAPALASQGSALLGSWSEVAYASGERAASSADGALTFATAAKVSGSSSSDGAFGATRLVAIAGSRFYVVWEESRGTPSSPAHVYVVVAR